MTFTLTKQQARSLGLPIEDEPKPKRARPRKRSATWTREGIEEWNGPDGWRVGIARMLRESGMCDMVVGWQDGKAGVKEVAEWEVFKSWTIEQVEMKLREMEKQG